MVLAEPRRFSSTIKMSLGSMQLRNVSYFLFEHELDGSWSSQSPEHHQLDGEVLFTFEDSPPVYISWGNARATYCIETRQSSFFSDSLLTRHEMNEHHFWSPLIGKKIELKNLDELHQVLKVSGGGATLFMSSQYDKGEFMGDCVRVSLLAPSLV